MEYLLKHQDYLFNLAGVMYRAASVTEISSSRARLKIVPRLRTAVPAGTVLESASISMNLSNPTSGRVERIGAPQQVTLEFVENLQEPV